MKVTTLNLQGFEQWEERQQPIIEYIQHERPDIILFQEVVYLPELSSMTRIQLLNNSLQYPYIQSDVSRLQTGIHYPVFREGLAVMSKHPIVSSETIVLKQAIGDPHNRIITLFDVYINDEVIKLANVHFSLTDDVDYATAHLSETMDIISSRNEQRIIAGDFNINDLDSLKSIWGKDYHASTEFDYVSFPGMNKRNDYVLLPKRYQFESVTTSIGLLSDHAALTADIRIN